MLLLSSTELCGRLRRPQGGNPENPRFFPEGCRVCFFVFFDFWLILGGFGRPKRKPKSIFGTFFFGVFFECVLASIFGRFLEARNLKNSNFASTGALFSQNRRIRKSSEKKIDFGSMFGSQSEENSRKNKSMKYVCF